MSMFDKLMDSFKSPSAETAVSPSGGIEDNSGNSNPNAGGGTNLPNSNPGTPKPSIPAPKTPNELLDELFQPDAPKVGTDGKPIPKAEPESLITLDNKSILDNASGIDFAAAITDDEAIAALGGDAKAFKAALNKAAAMGSAVSLRQNAHMIDAAVKKALSQYKTEVQSTIKDSSVETVIFSDSRFNSASVRPVAESIVRRIMEKDPTATPEKIKTALPKLIQAMSERMNPEDPKKKDQTKATNFDSFFD